MPSPILCVAIVVFYVVVGLFGWSLCVISVWADRKSERERRGH